jgi:uncharacterized protein YcbX
MKKLVLSELWIYPVKSLGGIRVNSSRVFEKGLEFDRRWMLVDDKGTFLTQRIHPRMALFKLAINGTQIIVQYRHTTPGTTVFPSVFIDASTPPIGETVRAVIWNDEVDVVEVDPNLSDWFSEMLEMNCRLVSFPEDNPRRLDPDHVMKNKNVSLADAYPFLLIGQASLDDLNGRLHEPLPMNRFRPNFVFAGGEPFEEDQWKEFVIGSSRFTTVRGCARCNLTTVDQQTAHRGVEPLLTLSGYRKTDNKVFFGQNVIALEHGVVNQGDEITLR